MDMFNPGRVRPLVAREKLRGAEVGIKEVQICTLYPFNW